MNEIERKIHEQTMHELNEARKECERLQVELTSAQGAIKTYIAGLGELSAERDSYKREFEEAHLECRNLRNQMRQVAANAVAEYIKENGPDPQPAESELERKAWEVFSQIPDVTIDESFYKASQWMYYRQQQRKAGAT